MPPTAGGSGGSGGLEYDGVLPGSGDDEQWRIIHEGYVWRRTASPHSQKEDMIYLHRERKTFIHEHVPPLASFKIRKCRSIAPEVMKWLRRTLQSLTNLLA